MWSPHREGTRMSGQYNWIPLSERRRDMRSELTILALWATIYITGLILAMFLIAVALSVVR